MKGNLDDFLTSSKVGETPTPKNNTPRKKKKRLKSTSLESFLPEEHVDYFKKLRIGSKKIRSAKIEEL